VFYLNIVLIIVYFGDLATHMILKNRGRYRGRSFRICWTWGHK